MYDLSKPRNVRQCFCYHDSKRGWGLRLGYLGRGGSNKDVGPISPPRGKPRMQTDIESQISYQRETLRQLTVERTNLEVERRQAQLELKKCENAVNHNKRARNSLNIALQKAEDRVEVLKAELDDFNIEDGRIDALKEELAEAQRDVVICQDSYGNCALEKEKLNKIAIEKKRTLDNCKANVEEHTAKLTKAQKKTRNTEQARRIALTEKNLSIDRIRTAQEAKAAAEQKYAKQVEQVANFAGQAAQVCERVPLGPDDTPQRLDVKLSKIKASLEEYKKKLGGSDKEIHDAAAEAQRRFETLQAYFADLKELLSILKQSFKARIGMFQRFQQHISARSRINFNYLLSERAFRGKLTIDHKAKKLDVHVEPDETVKGNKGRQTKTLSGGEKSFSSICLLLSLWEAMGAPLRCLDEFDVFMDDVNRDVSTRMIVSALLHPRSSILTEARSVLRADPSVVNSFSLLLRR